jgi:D-glucosaminate PTS system EIID component
MNEEIVKAQPEKLTKADITKSWIRWFAYAEVSNNFERLQALAFCGAMTGILQKLYKDKADLAAALKRHLAMYNTEGNWGCIINGISIALEEKAASQIHKEEDEEEEVGEDAIVSVKTGLMGPVAGIGDTIDFGTMRPILMGIFIPFAMAGSAFCALLPVIIQSIYTIVFGYGLYQKGYTAGRQSILEILQSGRIQTVITSASVLGMFMMGALSASYVKLTTTLTIGTAMKAIPVQPLIDQLAPRLLPLLVVMGIYIFLIKVGPKYIRIVTFLLVVSLVGAALGII